MITSALGLLILLASQTVNDDRDVIQTALLSFFHKEEWHSADWTPKAHVVLRIQLHSKARPTFDEEFKAIVEDCQSNLKYATTELKKNSKMTLEKKSWLKKAEAEAKADLAALEGIKSHLTEGAAYVPPPLVSLKSMAWNSRIILTDKSNRREFDDDKADRSLEYSTVYARTSRPTYSPNGRCAIVEFRIPWSIHSAKVRFVFERKDGIWVQVVVNAIFYV